MPDTRTERGTCRFVAEKGEAGKPVLRLELFHGTVPVLRNSTLSLNLLGGKKIGGDTK